MRAARGGDRAAFEELVKRYHSLVCTVAYGRLGQSEAAEDLAQEVFVKTYLHVSELDESRDLVPWLVRVTHNLATDWTRKGRQASRQMKTVPIEEVHAEIPDEGGKDARERAHEHEQGRAVERAIEGLGPDEREIILLHFVEDLSQKDIAHLLSVHPSTVGRQIKKALAAMRDSLEPILRESAAALRPSRRAALRAIANIDSAAAEAGGEDSGSPE